MDEKLLRNLNNRFQAIDRQIRGLVIRNGEVEKLLRSIIDHVNRDAPADQVGMYKEILARNVESATNYANLIIVGGYAGAFAVWQLTKDNLSNLESAIVGSLLLVSISLFAGFEVFKMTTSARLFNRLSEMLDDEGVENQSAAWQQLESWGQNRMAKVWPILLWPTIITGFGAGAALLYLLLRTIWHG